MNAYPCMSGYMCCMCECLHLCRCFFVSTSVHILASPFVRQPSICVKLEPFTSMLISDTVHNLFNTIHITQQIEHDNSSSCRVYSGERDHSSTKVDGSGNLNNQSGTNDVTTLARVTRERTDTASCGVVISRHGQCCHC